jgi:Peptidase A4 family
MLFAGALAWLCVLAPSAAAATSISSNWSGYLATPRASARAGFSSVSGSWRQPNVKCSPGGESYSATWVGLGGYSEASRALEQIGTDADCARSGGAEYSSWYELLPAGPVNLSLKVRPGDELSASVTVRGHGVTLRLRDLSTGARFTKTLRVSSIDDSSAEWIVEAPSVCASSNACETLPLSDFGDVAFSSATATLDGHTAPIPRGDWSATALELRQGPFHRIAGRAGVRAQPTQALTLATTSTASRSTGSFAVTWHEHSLEREQAPSTMLPGFGGGPP